MMRNILPYIASIALSFSYGQESESAPWTLEASVSHALTNNLQIKQAYLNVLDAQTNKSQATGNFLPSLNLSAAHSWNVGLNRNLTTNVFENMTNQFSNMSLDMGVTLYSGKRNIYQMLSANLGILARQFQLEDMKDDVVLLVVNGYLQVLFDKENLTIQNQQLLVATSELAETLALVDAGRLPRGELFELQATVANQEQSVVSAQNNFNLSRISLAQLLLLENVEQFTIADVDYDMVTSMILSKTPKELYDKALETRNDIMYAKTNVEIAQANLQIAKAAYQPTVSGFYSYSSRFSYADRLVPTGSFINVPIGTVAETGQQVVVPQPQTTIAPHLSIADQFKLNDGQNFGLSLRIPVLNGLSVKNNVRRSKVNVERSNAQLAQQEQQLERTIYQSYNDAKGALKAYEAAQKTTKARKESYQYALDRFNAGASTSLQFSQAKQRYDVAISTELRAKFDAIFKIKVLEFYFGIPLTL